MTKKMSAKVHKPIVENRFGFYTMLFTSTLITFIILFAAGYFLVYMEDLSLKYSENTQRTLTTLITSTYAKDWRENNFESSEYLINNLRQSNMIKYVYVVGKHANKVVWTTEKELQGTVPAKIKDTRTIKNAAAYVTEVTQNTPYYDIHIGYASTTMQTQKDANLLLDNMKAFIFYFLVLGLIASAIMSNIINRPLNNLIKGVDELSKGHFDKKLQRTNIKEINELVDAYNDMADELQQLYSSLEAKVQERTVELKKANEELKQTQAMMVHSEKMRSLGELVAGIAHEINNPINFIYGNIIHLERYSKNMLDLIDKYSQADDSLPENKKQELLALKKEFDIEFLKEDIKDLLDSCKEGTERTKKIILDLKNFSRLEESVLTEFDIPKEIDTTLNILRNKLKNRITVHKNYPDDLPKIEVYGGQLNQVFMNILDNAQYAIEGTGDIFIDIAFERKNVIIEIRDTGKGVDQKNMNKIFDPFYTTKPIGEGTGLGLSIAYKVVQNHGGTMSVTSEAQKGTAFKIVLPINPKEDKNG